MNRLNKNILAGLAWYTKDEWKKTKVISTDSEVFEDSFMEWESMALKALKDLRDNGIEAIKVYIKSKPLIDWCNSNSLPIDASSRSRYVSEMLSKSSITS
jgi:hypothetical protein